MRILGIDPGIAIVGFGLVEQKGSKLIPVQYGSIQTASTSRTSVRLSEIYDAMLHLLDTYKPEAMAIEKLFFNKNVTTAMTVAQARGIMILAAEQRGVEIAEYTPLQVKQAVVGYGKAEKRQVQEMTRAFLNLSAVPKPDDVADALAIAICHAHAAPMAQRIQQQLEQRGRGL